jgi:putative membrane protein
MQQLHPKAVKLFFINNWILWFILFWIVIFPLLNGLLYGVLGTKTLAASFLIGSLILPVIIAYILAKLSYRYYRYELTDENFRKEHGVIWKSYTTIPYDRIQNVNIHRGIIARMLGLSTLVIETAGGARAEGVLPGLSMEVAEQLRNDLIQRAKRSRSSSAATGINNIK